MLEKEREARPQTPSELRQEIEKGHRANPYRRAGPIHSPRRVDPEDFATVLEDAPTRPADTTFNVGTTSSPGRYKIIARLGDTNTGVVFRAAAHRRYAVPVRMLVLHRELTLEPATATQIEREVERADAGRASESFARLWHRGDRRRELHHDGMDRGIFTARSPARTARTRSRRSAQAARTGGSGRRLRARLQASKNSTLRCIKFSSTSPAPFDKHALLHHPVTQWPEFVLKLNPLGITRDLSASETWSGEQTVVGRPSSIHGGIFGQCAGDAGARRRRV